MKSQSSIHSIAIIGLIIAGLVVAAPASAQRRASGQISGGCGSALATAYDAIEAVPLSAYEEAEIAFLREEEKLARDVYLNLAERWQLPIFNNIAGAEQRHMDLVSRLFETYGFEDPITDDTVGVFADSVLGQLYEELVARGEQSITEALMVGATIEDLDLADLDHLLAESANQHVALVAQNLTKGSRNHLRAFMAALTAQGGSFAPQYLDQQTFDEIVASDFERGVVYGTDGSVLAECGRRSRGQGMRRGPRANGTGNGTCDGSGNGVPSTSGDCDGNGPQGQGQPGGNGSGECDGQGPHGQGGNGNQPGGQGSGNGNGN